MVSSTLLLFPFIYFLLLKNHNSNDNDGREPVMWSTRLGKHYGLWRAGACDVIQTGGQYGRHLGLYSKVELTRQWNMQILHARHVQLDIGYFFPPFLYLLFTLKVKNHT